MHTSRRLAVCVSVAGIAVASLVGPVASAAPSRNTATVTKVIRPVTAAGLPAKGYRVTVERAAFPIDCSFRQPSPAAIDRNIEECSPSAAYAVACWKASTAHHVLCLSDPTSHRLYRFTLTGKFAKTAAINPAARAGLAIVLVDGTVCSIRDGGAWSSLKGHPDWSGSYSCSRHGVVWAPPGSKDYGINKASASWSVRTGPESGNGELTVRHIKRVYLVGTAPA